MTLDRQYQNRKHGRYDVACLDALVNLAERPKGAGLRKTSIGDQKMNRGRKTFEQGAHRSVYAHSRRGIPGARA